MSARPPLARTLGDFVASLTDGGLPAEVREKADLCLLNGYGIGLGCRTTPYAPVAGRAALDLFGDVAGGATLLLNGDRTAVPGAALANAALFHGRAQEDTCGAAHLGAIVIPLLTALFETEHYPMDRFRPALVAGYEAGGLFEAAYAAQTTPAGLRASPLYGTIAAAAAAARAMALPGERVAAALANAASFTGGILQSFADGTDEWRYQVGVAAVNGLMAARLAAAGSVSAPNAFEGSSGFARAFARVPCDVDGLADRLGRDWSILRVTYKPYPVCAFNQTPVIAALALRERIDGRPVAGVRVWMNPYETGYAGMDSRGPFDSVSGTLMSIPFCIAATLLHGAPTMPIMTTYDDAAVNALVERVTLVPDDGVDRLCARIEADLEDGETLRQEQRMTVADYAYSREEVAALIRRVGVDADVPEASFAAIESFVDGLPASTVDSVVGAFRLAARGRVGESETV